MPSKTTRTPARRRSEAEVLTPAQRVAAKLSSVSVKSFGGAAFELASKLPERRRLSTGWFPLDLALCGGWQEGRAVMLYGLESSGKSMLAALTVAAFQRANPNLVAVWIDAEKLADEAWMQKLGVDLDRLLITVPDTGEAAVDAVALAMSDENVGMIVNDSLPAFAPKAVAERSAEDKTMGALAALLGILNSKILTAWGERSKTGKPHCTVVNLNQWRMKLGLVFGDPRTLPGGRQINHLPWAKVELAKVPPKTQRGKADAAEAEKEDRNRAETRKEYRWRIEKSKGGQIIKEGACMMIHSSGDPTGLPVGSVYDHPALLSYATRCGLIAGSPQRLYSEVFDLTWQGKAAALKFLSSPEGADTYLAMRQIVIAAYRSATAQLPLVPDDGALLGVKVSREILQAAGHCASYLRGGAASTATDTTSEEADEGEEDDNADG